MIKESESLVPTFCKFEKGDLCYELFTRTTDYDTKRRR